MTIHKCPGCPLLFWNEHNRVYCSNECRNKAKAREQDARYAEFLWIADTDLWDNIATRLGFASRASLEHWLERRGEHQWAARVHSTGMPRTYLRAA